MLLISDEIEEIENNLHLRNNNSETATVLVEIYKKFIAEVMKGREIKFNLDVLVPYADAISERYFRSKEEKESAISNALFNSGEFLTLEDIKPVSDDFSNLPLFSLNGKEWKIRDFEKQYYTIVVIS